MGEKRQNIKLVALDMDGTLLKSNQEVSQENQEAIAAAKEKNVDVMLCTGRWLQSCYTYAEELELNTYIVTSNGGEIWTASKELLERHLHDPNLVEEMWSIGNELDVFMWMVSTQKIYHERPEDFLEYDWLKIGFHSDDQQKLQTIREQLSSKQALEITNSSPANIEVNPVGVNKANGIERVCQEMDITMEEVMAVGDSLNDIKMIEQAGIGVAMGNAQDTVKQAADYIVESNENDGVAEAIKRFVL